MKRFRLRAILLPLLGLIVGAMLLTSWLGPRSLSRQQIQLGTVVQIKVYGPDPQELERALSAAFEEISRIQSRFSRSGEGELGRLNRSPPGQPVPVSEELFGLLEQAQHFHRLTQGAFDPSLGALSDLWGFVQDWDGQGRVPSAGEIDSFLATPHGFELDPQARAVTRASEATQLDLGGIAKGYAVDRALAVLKTFRLRAALVNAGGNVGVFGAVPEGVWLFARSRPFRVAVQHPRRPNEVLGTLSLAGGRAVATSGDYQRFFTVGGVRYHHVLDPQTGRPARALISATVLADSALSADALSTGVFVLGPQRGLQLVARLPGVEAVLVTPAGEVLTSSGLDKGGFSF